MPKIRKARVKAHHATEKPLPSIKEQSKQVSGELSESPTLPDLQNIKRFSDATVLPELQVPFYSLRETGNCAAPRLMPSLDSNTHCICRQYFHRRTFGRTDWEITLAQMSLFFLAVTRMRRKGYNEGLMPQGV